MVRVLDVEKGVPEPQDVSVQRGSPPPRAAGARAPRLSPLILVALALLAGLGAMVLGGLAVLQATNGAEGVTGPTATQERELRHALLLLAKPSTVRVPFRGAAGTLVLAVGSGGRAALVLRGFATAPAGKVHRAWIVSSSGRARRAATFTGGQQVVALTGVVTPGSSVVVTTGSVESGVPPGRSARIVARPRG